MDVECLCHRAEAVSGVYVAAMTHVVVQTPAQLVVLAVLPIVIPEFVQVVDIGTLCADHLAEHAVLGHVQRIHFEPVVTAVLQNHAMLAVFLAQVDQLPAFLQVHGRRYFNGHVLAVLQSTLGNGEVMQPVGSDVNQVNVIALAELFIALGARIDGSFRQGSFLEQLLAALGTFLLIVAKSYNLSTGDISEALYSTRTTHAQAHKAHTHNVHLREGQSQHALLSGRTFGRFHYDGSLFPLPLRTLVVRLNGRGRLCGACTQSQ